MPYYREYFDNSSTQASMVAWNGVTTFYPGVWDDCTIMGWRSRPHRNAAFSTEVSDLSVDPYAYFLGEASKNQYAKRLAERNLVAEGDPDRGHAFQLSKYTLSGPRLTFSSFEKNFGSPEAKTTFGNCYVAPTADYVGLGYSDPDPLAFRPLPADTGLATFAQQAYSRAAPSSVVFDAAQFLGELREGLPRLATSLFSNGTKFYKGLGSDYLNVEFGWKPFINDIIKAGQALAGATELLHGRGRRVHRFRGTPPVLSNHTHTRSTSTSVPVRLGNPGARQASYGLPVFPLAVSGAGPRAKWYFLRTTEVTRWFEGEFTNFLPLGFDPSNYLARLNELVNVKLTPQVLWELAPWSWLVDWHLRIGDTIKANELAANDKLVMHYGYAMEHTVHRDLLSMDFSDTLTSSPGTSEYRYIQGLPNTATYISTTEHKVRLRANPFGFRTGGASALNGGQLQILGALGLTKLK